MRCSCNSARWRAQSAVEHRGIVTILRLPALDQGGAQAALHDRQGDLGKDRDQRDLAEKLRREQAGQQDADQKHDKKKQKLAAALMLLLPGMPMIYYGDEVGLDGGFDPDNRRGMIWDEDKADWDMFAWYKRLLSIRRQYASLSRGECEICADDDLGVITIQLNDKTLAVLNVTSQTLSFEDLTEQSVMGEKLLRFNDSFNLLQDGDFSCKIAGLEAVILQLK